MKLSVVLATFNEEKFIADCLNSVKDIAEEIIVVDGYSQDKTREIARSFGAIIIKTINRPMFHINKQMAIEKAKGKWVLQLDADEVVDKELADELIKITKSDSKYQAFSIRRKNYFLGKWLKKGGQYPDPVIRFFLNGKAKFPQKSVHEQIEVRGKVRLLEGHLLHYTAPDFSRYMTNFNRYTSLTADELHKRMVNISLFNIIKYLIIKPTVTFLSIFVRHKGFMDGFHGFVFALFSGLHWTIAFMKLWELINS
jgi:glycosyltransferase involved in cell wall biosynthesis